jgi:hypothetical protein
MLDLDFIEIGTADFDTLIQVATPEQRGISIEAVPHYINKLPNIPNVTKLNVAIVTEEQKEKSPYIDVYYVPEPTIWQYGLGDWMKGCNSVGRPHDFHTKYFHNPSIWHHATDEERSSFETRDLVKEGLVREDHIPCITYSMLMNQFEVGKVKLLKTDTEGQDAELLIDIINNYYIKYNKLNDLPEKIMFEDNVHSNKQLMIEAKNLLRQVGYDVIDDHVEVHDSYAILKRG